MKLLDIRNFICRKVRIHTIVPEQTEKLFREREELFRTLIHKIQAAVVVLGADTRIITCNAKAQELLGLTENQALRKTAVELGLQFLREDNSVMPLEEYPGNFVATTKKELRDYIVGIHRPNDNINIWALVSADPVLNKKNEILQIIITFIDITNRKNVEEKLRLSEDRFRRLTENARDVIYRMSLPDGEYEYISPAVYSLLGHYPEEYYANQSLFKQSVHPNWHQYIEEQWINLLKGEMPPTYEYQIIHKSGEIKWVNQRNILVRDDNGNPTAIEGIVTDITQHKKLEEELRQSEMQVKQKLETILSPDADISKMELFDIIDSEMLQKLMNEFYRLTKIGIGIIDLEGKVLIGTGWQDICTKFHRTNPQSCNLCRESDLELSTNVIPGTYKLYHCKNNMWDIATPIMLGDKHVGNIFLGQFLFDDEQPNYEIFRQQAKKFGFNEQEYIDALERVPRWNRETVTAAMSFYSAFAGMIGNLSYSNLKLVYALEERKRMEVALRKSEWRYRDIFDNVMDGLYLLDITDNGRFRTVEVNPALERLTGIPRDLSLGKTQEEIVPPETAEIVNAKYRRCVEAGHPIDEEVALDLPSGKRYFHSTLIPARDETEKIHRIIGISRDITDRKKAEEEIVRYREHLEELVKERTAQLEAANKELESFSYSVSHDLRAPLRGIDGFSYLLLEKYKENMDNEGKNFLERIRAASRHMAQLIDDILSLSRVTRSEMNIQEVDLSKIAWEIAQNLQESQPERQVDFIISERITTKGDARLLRIVLENLFGNAWKYTSKHPTAQIEFGVQQNNGISAYFIHDDGAGFDMNYVHKLFGAFQRLHDSNEFPGTGIGLATVQRIIHRHGGKIWAEGAVEKGATVYFTICR